MLVTGGAGGIGCAVARELERRGAEPVLADLDRDALAEAAARFARAPQQLVMDVTSRASCAAAIGDLLAHHGRLDIAWANAGISAFGPVSALDPDTWRRVVDVNLLGAFETLRASLPAVTARRGHLAVTCSLASFSHQPGVSAYAASKAGLEALANALRIEVADQGVTVGTIHPGYVQTPLVLEQERDDPAYRRLRAALRPPFAVSVPVERVSPVIADGLAKRASRVIAPRSGWLVHALRPVLNTRPLTRELRRAAPDIRELFGERAGARVTPPARAPSEPAGD